MIYVVANVRGEEYNESFSDEGKYYNDCGECLLFPSRENRDWSTFKVEKEGFKVGDYIKVLADSPEDEEIRKSAGIEKQRNIAQKKTFEDLYRVLEGITKGYTEEIKEE